jgi:hypothetical protein
VSHLSLFHPIHCLRSFSLTLQSTHRVATTAFWRTFHHDGKICPDWWGWGGAQPFLTIFTITYKVGAERADTLPLLHLYPYVLCGLLSTTAMPDCLVFLNVIWRPDQLIVCSKVIFFAFLAFFTHFKYGLYIQCFLSSLCDFQKAHCFSVSGFSFCPSWLENLQKKLDLFIA